MPQTTQAIAIPAAGSAPPRRSALRCLLALAGAITLAGVASATDYQGAALVMLARIAQQEGAAAAA